MFAKALLLLIGVAMVTAITVMAKNAYDTSFAKAAEPPTGPILNIDGVRVHAHTEGLTDPDAPTLILLHGAGGNTREFTFSLTGKLADRFRIVAFDRPGHGHTDRIPDRAGNGESPQEQAALLNAAAQTLGLKNYLILGHSYGGAVAMAWAVNHPEEVRGVLMLAAVSHPWEGGLKRWYQITNSWPGRNVLLPTLSAFATKRRIVDTLEGIFEPDPVPDGYMDHIGINLSKTKDTLQATTQQVNDLKPHVIALAPGYPDLTIPIESVHGTADVTVPLETHATPLDARVPTNTLTVLENVGHMPHHVDEPTVIAAIDRLAKRAGLTN